MTRMAWIRRGAGIAVFGALAVGFLGAQSASRGNKEFYQYSSINIKRLAADKIRMTVLGNPVKADLVTQKMSLTASKFVGDVVQKTGGLMSILTADITGNVVLVASRPSSDKQSKALQTFTIDTEVVSFDGPTNKATIPGKVDVRREDKGAGQTLTASASSGWATLFPAGESGRSAVKSMHFAGPIVMKMTSIEVKAGKSTTNVVNARADRLDYDDATGKMTLTGHVHVDGDHPMLFGDIDASKVVFTFDAKGEVDEIDVTGEPATTNINRKPPPPKSGGRR